MIKKNYKLFYNFYATQPPDSSNKKIEIIYSLYKTHLSIFIEDVLKLSIIYIDPIKSYWLLIIDPT